MAATVTYAWGKPGAWALDSEEHDDELKQVKTPPPTKGTGQSSAVEEMSEFPDLMTAAATKTKKKGKTFSLGEFVTGSTNKSKAYQAAKGLTAEDITMLPTGPRERTAGESALGGGFRSYGDRNDSSNSRRGSNRSSGGGGADENDDWGSGKKSTFGGGGFDRKERTGGGFFESSYSRADESDNWGKKKEEEGRRSNGCREFDSLRERKGGNELSDSDNWGRKGEETVGGGSMNRPKLNLQPRKVAVGGGETAIPKSNKGWSPFGDAKPREQVLKEKGKDWREIDEKLESMNMKDVGSGDGQTEKRWKKNEPVMDVLPSSSAANNENGNEDKDAEG